MGMKVFVGIPTRDRNHLLDKQFQALEDYPLVIHYLFNDTDEPNLFYFPSGAELSITYPNIPLQGAETKTYNIKHLANLWNVLLSLAKLHEATHFMVLGSDVIPEENCIQLILDAAHEYPDRVIGAVVPVNADGLANYWELDGKRGTTTTLDNREVSKFAGGLVLFPITSNLEFNDRNKSGEIVGATEHKKCFLISDARCKNIRPNGEIWQ